MARNPKRYQIQVPGHLSTPDVIEKEVVTPMVPSEFLWSPMVGYWSPSMPWTVTSEILLVPSGLSFWTYLVVTGFLMAYPRFLLLHPRLSLVSQASA